MDFSNILLFTVVGIILAMVIMVVLFILALYYASTIPDKKNVIIVDDNRMFLADIIQFFDKIGVNTTAVETVEEFNKNLQENDFDFAVVDLGLNGNDLSKGIELFHRIYTAKYDTKDYNLEVFILSGYELEETEAKLEKAFEPEIKRGASWETLKRDIHSRYFSKNNIQDFIQLTQKIAHSN
jgi:CheY-like chemotaxis protein